ncbi:transglutaminase family protein [Egicoccus halophilus]|uniref:Transglutaminase-like protein n=1 Tax=Egicoccus halophilus TaxID=1670830 RepID=A0A8J3ADA1_9ACTN|nr:transglutaminase family protein [Egicoccus halophilus]GGI05092.1 transglutaminase-like protein [Egicoccus halophilus]
MRLDIRYTTRFVYEAPVVESQNELRACPASDERQQLVHYDVTTTPSSRVASYVDYWGTRVDTFGIRGPHQLLEVAAEATVETLPVVAPTVGLPRAALQDPVFRDRHQELLQRSAHVDWGTGVAAAARRHAEGAGDDVLALVHAVHEGAAELSYAPGRTYVGVPVEKVLAAGGGVCQDFAHLAIAMYRSLGVPARYVSGYFFTRDDATGADVHEAEEVEVVTHAWVEVAVPLPAADGGRGVGAHLWLALDPTNRQPVGERHVTIGRGRDYDDVSPFRGVFSGPPAHELSVNVRMRRLALEPLGDVAGTRRPAVGPSQRQQQQ